MNKFTFNPMHVLRWDSEAIAKSVFDAGNETFTSYNSSMGWIVVECEHKPKNLFASNIIWEEFKGE